ncbi:phenylalanine--tRNA ligase subunit beta [Candidatus Dependentiae bacterium]|nr:phenylalanine--tRNA ligase subunit beta [Candidatus Dependentiae bacterium]
MKILLSWLLDYIDCSLTDINIHNIIHLFNIRTAEIESYERISLPITSWYAGQARAIIDGKVDFWCPERDELITLAARKDIIIEKWYLVVLENGCWRWLLLSDLDKDREGIMPAVHVEKKDQKGTWRIGLLEVDYVFDVDNKSINHRPDLWGHYGIAREIAAFLNKPLRPLDSFLHHHPIVSYQQISGNYLKEGISVEIQNQTGCSRFAAVKCKQSKYQDCSVQMAIRLALVGAKPMNAIVDLTNYVMFDIGHPMHVFDAAAFSDNSMIVREAFKGESLQLLDEQDVKLESVDIVIADKSHAVSLAGIMGGASSGYHEKTEHIILEAAGFNPAMIRKTAQRLKLRSEASMRFEKDLDPMQNIVAIQRFLYLAKLLGVLSVDTEFPIVSVGKTFEQKTCKFSHHFIQVRLGMNIESEFILKSLKKLGFHTLYDKETHEYQVTIPTYRATKDINIAEDIIEEIIRSFGFENIVPQMPVRAMVPFELDRVFNLRKIKEHLAHGMHMHELREYMMYDASFITKLTVDLVPAVHVKSPLSENWTMLVTSLIPHLVKAVVYNNVEHDHLRFFEFNRIWSKDTESFLEHKVLSGIMYDKKSLDFYNCKSELATLFDMLGISVTYKKSSKVTYPWYDTHQSAELVYQGKVIGTAGMVSYAWMHKVVDGHAFIFEIDGEFLENLKAPLMKFKSWSKYQDVSYDISLFVPFVVTSDTLSTAIKSAHQNIIDVHVVDFFEKQEWPNHRAVTVRYTMSNLERTMTKSDLDQIVVSVGNALKEYNVEIR